MTTEASVVSEADTEGKQKAGGAEPDNNQKPESAAAAAEGATVAGEGEKASEKAPEKTSEPGPANATSPPTEEEEQLKPRTRTSAGKGLSRLFSSFLKRRSQCSEGEGFEAEKAGEEKADKEKAAKEDKVEEDKEEELEGAENKAAERKGKGEKKEEKEGEGEKKKEGKANTKDNAKEKKEDEAKKTEVGKGEASKEAKKREEEKGEKEGKKKEKDAKKKKEEEKAKRKEEERAKEQEKAKKKEEEKAKRKEEERKKEEEKAKKKEEEKAKKKEEERKKEEEKAKKKVVKNKEEEQVKKKEEEKTKEEKAKKEAEKKKEEEKAKKEEEKRKEEEKERAKKEEEKRKEEEKAKEEERAKEEEKAKKKEEEQAKEEKAIEEEKAKEHEEKGKEGEEVKSGEAQPAEKKEVKKKEEKSKKKEKRRRGRGKREEKGEEAPAEEQAKAPIAAPEPELRAEADQTQDQLSLSSADNQPTQEKSTGEPDKQKASSVEEEKKEEEEEEAAELLKAEETKEEAKEEEVKGEESEEESEEGEEEEEEEEKHKEGEQKKTEEGKPSKRQRTMQCKVTLLDDTLFECELDKHAKGQELFARVCDHLNLLEKDYYGLAIWETRTVRTWLDPTKEIRKQVSNAVYEFTFNVKFYPPDPAQLTEDLTRYYLCLQLRKDILGGSLPCSFVTLALLGSYTAQSELGEYDPEVHGADYVKELRLAPGQSTELEEKVMELHRSYRSMTPAQADMMFLENAKKLSMYGVDLHQAKDLDGVDIMLGVCSSGLMVYKDKLRINRFPWPKVLKLSYKRSSFFIKIRASEQEQYESTIGFKLPNYKASKKLWKVSVEHHTFFRVSTVEPPSSRRFLGLGSKFRYSGRTQAQTRQASSMIDRPAPRFTRSASKRLSQTLDGVMGLRKGVRPVSAPVFSQAALAEAGIPMAPLDQPQTSTPVSWAVRQEDRKLEVTVEAPEPAKPDAGVKSEEMSSEPVRMRKDYDKPQEEILRHHASISELKRNFMESVPEPRPSEWDKRLSGHSPFRSAVINGQPQAGADGVTMDVTGGDKDGMQSVTSETASGTTVTTTTTHISKVVKSGSSETRVEKRIVITADSEADKEQGSEGASAM